ncbi:hypothetical protein BKA70DRAFT_1356689 [Coprinopsis sp. MPI-PUGE-AT-0042]|nr:hypothetical protein BKA70DRAFT_1356689 [Coprinopsis sp. MPI-PUGE-AT-0042]
MSTMLGTTTFDCSDERLSMPRATWTSSCRPIPPTHGQAQDDGIMEEDTSFSMATAAKNPGQCDTVTMFMPATTEGSDQQNEAAHQHSHSPLPPPPLDIAPEVTLDVPPGEPRSCRRGTPYRRGRHQRDCRHNTRFKCRGRSCRGSSPRAAICTRPHDAEDHVPSGHQVVSEHHHEAEAAIDEVDVGDHVEVESNPHEIADGVFIEPVPAVVVQASFSDQPFVLFNRPPASRAHSPSPDDDVPSDIAEELVAQQPDMHHIELGFSIETLQLSIFEDNTHAKEFSLFQLNTLHDSFHTGSLRVTLLQQAPRFITRYHELREHLHHLGVNTNDDGLLTAVPVSHFSSTSTGESIAEQREVVEQQHEHAEQVKEDEQEVVEEVLGHEGVDHKRKLAGEPTARNGEHGQVEDAQSEVQDGHAEVGAHAQGPVEEAEVPEQPHETEQPEVDHSGHGAGPFEESEEVTEDLTAWCGRRGVAGDHDEHAQESWGGRRGLRTGVVEGVDNVTEGGDEHEYQEGEHEHEGSEQLEEEYGKTGDDSEHSGDGTHEEETQEADPATNGDDSEDQEDELPPMTPVFVEAVVAEVVREASASTQDEWLGEGYSLTGEELQDSETQHSILKEMKMLKVHYIGDNILVYAEGDNEDAEWDQDLDGEGEADPSWGGRYTGHEVQVANDSTASVRSKRGFHELGPTPSPESKRSRLE